MLSVSKSKEANLNVIIEYTISHAVYINNRGHDFPPRNKRFVDNLSREFMITVGARAGKFSYFDKLCCLIQCTSESPYFYLHVLQTKCIIIIMLNHTSQ